MDREILHLALPSFPLQVLVDAIYEDEETSPLDGINAVKQLINSLRHHFGDGLVRARRDQC